MPTEGQAIAQARIQQRIEQVEALNLPRLLEEARQRRTSRSPRLPPPTTLRNRSSRSISWRWCSAAIWRLRPGVRRPISPPELYSDDETDIRPPAGALRSTPRSISSRSASAAARRIVRPAARRRTGGALRDRARRSQIAVHRLHRSAGDGRVRHLPQRRGRSIARRQSDLQAAFVRPAPRRSHDRLPGPPQERHDLRSTATRSAATRGNRASSPFPRSGRSAIPKSSSSARTSADIPWPAGCSSPCQWKSRRARQSPWGTVLACAMRAFLRSGKRGPTSSIRNS